jgi:hypothetical protein
VTVAPPTGIIAGMSRGAVFVVGMPRSGTTVARSVLDAHSQLSITPETHLVDHWMRLYPADLDGPDAFDAFWSDFVPSVDFTRSGVEADVVLERIRAAGPPSFRTVFTALLEAYADKTGKPRLGEKTPGHYRSLDVLFDWFPDAQALFMIRDPRAVVASFRTLELEWTDHPVEVIAARWRRSIEIAEKWAADLRVRVVRYETFVADPETEVRKTCAWLGEAFEPGMLGERDPRGTGSRQHGAVDTTSVERWRTELDADTVAVIEHIAGPAMTRLGYERVGRRLRPHRRAVLSGRVLARRAIGGVGTRLKGIRR